MGKRLSFLCSKCGFTFESSIGIGMMFPVVYSETVSKMKAGIYGKQGNEFFKQFPDGAIDCENVILQCQKCRNLMKKKDLTMYVPKEKGNPTEEKKRRWSVAFPASDISYVSPMDLQENYFEYQKYNHKCPECSGTDFVIYSVNNCPDLKCPRCNIILEICDIAFAD